MQEKKISDTEKKKMDKIRKKQIDIANRFKDEVLKKYKNVVKAVVLFGSLIFKTVSFGSADGFGDKDLIPSSFAHQTGGQIDNSSQNCVFPT